MKGIPYSQKDSGVIADIITYCHASYYYNTNLNLIFIVKFKPMEERAILETEMQNWSMLLVNNDYEFVYKVIGYTVQGDRWGFVYEPVTYNLAVILKEDFHKFNFQQKKHILLAVAKSIQQFHFLGIVFNNLNPGCIMLKETDGSFTVKLDNLSACERIDSCDIKNDIVAFGELTKLLYLNRIDVSTIDKDQDLTDQIIGVIKLCKENPDKKDALEIIIKTLSS